MAAIDTLLRRMGELNSSDMHLASGFRPYFRIHGSMVEQKEWPVLTASNIMALVKEIAPPHNVRQFEEEHDTDFAHEIPGENRYRGVRTHKSGGNPAGGPAGGTGRNPDRRRSARGLHLHPGAGAASRQ